MRVCRVALPVLLAARALACVAVEGEHVLAKDLVPENPWFAQLNPDLEIGLTPLAGVPRVINGAELAAFARHHPTPEMAHGFPAICVERAAAPLTPERLQPVLEQALGGSPVKILEYSRYPVPHGRIEFARTALGSTGLWRGRVIYGPSHSVPIWARVTREPAVPALLTMPSGPAPTAQAPRDFMSSDLISRDIERGERITVEVTSGAARLAFQATAESAGHAGGFVLVRNPENGRLLQARVLGNGKVLIRK